MARKRVKRVSRISEAELKLLKQQEECQSKKIKRIFFTFLDIIILCSFSLCLYFTYFEDYTKTILFLVVGAMLLLFFIIRTALRKHRR